MTETEIREQIAAQRGELADLLDELDARDWAAPSLCEGWRVREVLAHMTMPFRLSTPRFVLDMITARGNFDRMADRAARRDTSTRTDAELLACLRENADHPWKPPGGGFAGALSHDVIHGLDITVALGIDRVVPPERMRHVLDANSARSVRYFGVDLRGVELRADDIDWTYGSGAPLTGRAQDLLLVLCGRRLPPGHLRGAAAWRFTREA
ncbi:maleylpyruvate isomerase family mycothiol-dependent enzyme [Nocardia bovistercoris]|uniref:maleylpyruvate isomerase family mycothiol-dependent enzyme n=1 Tax=Nocardia bovistercoris TaxID=2785916 RepID=UPI002FCD046A